MSRQPKESEKWEQDIKGTIWWAMANVNKVTMPTTSRWQFLKALIHDIPWWVKLIWWSWLLLGLLFLLHRWVAL